MVDQWHSISCLSRNSVGECALIVEELVILLLAIIQDALGMELPPELGMYLLYFRTRPVQTKECMLMRVKGAPIMDDICHGWCNCFPA